MRALRFSFGQPLGQTERANLSPAVLEISGGASHGPRVSGGVDTHTHTSVVYVKARNGQPPFSQTVTTPPTDVKKWLDMRKIRCFLSLSLSQVFV